MDPAKIRHGSLIFLGSSRRSGWNLMSLNFRDPQNLLAMVAA
jgi:hypothetical protein